MARHPDAAADIGRLPRWVETEALAPVLDRIRPFTMVPDASLIALARQVAVTLACDIPGDFVECGVWRGGSSLLMAELLRRAGVRDRKVWLVDSFEGLPPPEPVDGERAAAYVAQTDGPYYFDNCRAPLEQVRQAARELGLEGHVEYVKGWFDDVLPSLSRRIGPVAILRIDADWYRSVRCVLEHLYDRVAEGGFVVLDDYYTFDGCAIAVHEFLARRQLAHPIESIVDDAAGYPVAALFRKGGRSWYATWAWHHRMELTRRELADIVPERASFIFVDLQQLQPALPPARRAIPFLERGGQYWGPPPDDGVAIDELERLRREGARLLVITWPAFWWLEHYAAFQRHLDSRYRRILQNERVVAFDLGREARRTSP